MDLRTEKKEKVLVVKKPSDVIREFSPAQLTLNQKQRVIDFILERARLAKQLNQQEMCKVTITSIRQAHSDIPLSVPDEEWKSVVNEIGGAGWGIAYANGTSYNDYFDLDNKYFVIKFPSSSSSDEEGPMSSGQCVII